MDEDENIDIDSEVSVPVYKQGRLKRLNNEATVLKKMSPDSLDRLLVEKGIKSHHKREVEAKTEALEAKDERDWRETTKELENRHPPAQEQCKMDENLLSENITEADIFRLLFHNGVVDHIVTETNRYIGPNVRRSTSFHQPKTLSSPGI